MALFNLGIDYRLRRRRISIEARYRYDHEFAIFSASMSLTDGTENNNLLATFHADQEGKSQITRIPYVGDSFAQS